jgi:hypothetical protein
MKKLVLVGFLVVAIWFTYRSCSSAPTEPAKIPAPVVEAPPPAALNATFPKGTGEFKFVFTQEKEGFAQGEWMKGSIKLATLSVADTKANPSARDKFKETSKKIAGFPAATIGAQGTAVLVADRFQVQVRSTSPSFSPADREALLSQCNLRALAGR